ncbi:hypothetical protein [Actinomyces sp. ZJ308]|nr:hypothetical protein [Actinomyces sp. ZJ308]
MAGPANTLRNHQFHSPRSIMVAGIGSMRTIEASSVTLDGAAPA